MLTMYKQITIKTLDKQGLKQSEIARQIGCHRHTITNVLQREKFIEKQTRKKGSFFDPHQQQIKEWREKKISILRMFEILAKTYDIHSTYVNLCKYIQVHFPKQQEAFGVQVTEPGEVAEIDFGYLGMLPGPSGKLVKTYGLAVILPYSKLDFYAITYDQKLETLVKELENAFLYFGGVPKRLKVDNMKTAILKNHHYDLEFNQDFLEFAYHYNTVIIPCTPYHPEQKGTVEAGIKYLQGNFISGRTFQDSRDMKQQLRNWMDNYANKRVHGTTRKVPVEEFRQIEASTLQLLPDTPFAFFNRGIRTVATNCHIHFENNYYSVPASLVGKDVTLRFNDKLIRIVYEGEQIALHQKATGVGNYVTKRSHLPDYKIYSETEYQKRAEEQMADIGEEAHEYFRFLLETKDNYWFRSVRAILGLSKEYGSEPVNKTLKRAMYYKATDLTTLKNILEKKLYLVSEEPRLMGRQVQQADYSTEQTSLLRDLSYYTISERSTV
ncbi:MAG: IS21 family transposase [Candidatus Nomurabacteria bacterium]|nr:IS21 family transposase [Candidatus Nomurabacteria bacterium]